MSDLFKNRIAPKKMTTSKEFVTPSYDDKSLFMRAGIDYGVGFNQNVGTKTQSDKSAVPKGAFSEKD